MECSLFLSGFTPQRTKSKFALELVGCHVDAYKKKQRQRSSNQKSKTSQRYSKVNIWTAHVRPNSWSLMLKCIMDLNPESIHEILRLTITRTGQPYTNLTEQFFLFLFLKDIHLGWKRSMSLYMLLWTSDLLSNIHMIQHFTTTLQAKQC